MSRPDSQEFMSFDGFNDGPQRPESSHSQSFPPQSPSSSSFLPSPPLQIPSSPLSSEPVVPSHPHLPPPSHSRPLSVLTSEALCLPDPFPHHPQLVSLIPERPLFAPPHLVLHPFHHPPPFAQAPPPASPHFLEIKALQYHAKESEDLARNLECQLQVNQLKHLQKLLTFQASMSYMQAMKISAAADQTGALAATLDTALRHGGPSKSSLARSSLIQDHINAVSKQLEMISQNPMAPLHPNLPHHHPGGPAPASLFSSLSSRPELQDVESFHPQNLLALEGEFKRLKEAAQSQLRHPLSLSFVEQQQEHQHQLQLQQQQAHSQQTIGKLLAAGGSGGGSDHPSPFRSFPKKEEGHGGSGPTPASPSHKNLSPTSSLSPTSPSTPSQNSQPATNEEKHQMKRRLIEIDANNKKQKGEKGIFFCEDPTCGAELRTRSGFRRHRQKHASGHVLRKRARKSPTSLSPEPMKPMDREKNTDRPKGHSEATPATVVSQRGSQRGPHTPLKPHTPLTHPHTPSFAHEFPALFSEGLL